MEAWPTMMEVLETLIVPRRCYKSKYFQFFEEFNVEMFHNTKTSAEIKAASGLQLY